MHKLANHSLKAQMIKGSMKIMQTLSNLYYNMFTLRDSLVLDIITVKVSFLTCPLYHIIDLLFNQIV